MANFNYHFYWIPCFAFVFPLFKKMEAQESSTDNTQTQPIECITRDDLNPEVTSAAADWLEMEVAAGFRIWQLMFLALAGLICLVVFLCCCMKCRIPRTKQEIEADFIRKKLCKRFRTHLNKLSIEDDTNFKGALDKVKQLCEKEPSPSAKKAKKKEKDLLEGGEDLTGSQSALVGKAPKLTFMEKLRKLMSPAQRESQDEENPEIQGEDNEAVKVTTESGSTDSSNSQEPISIVGITVELAKDDEDEEDDKEKLKEDSNSEEETKTSTESETESDAVQPSDASFQRSRTIE